MVTSFFILDMALISAGSMYHTLLIVGGKLCSKAVYSDPIMYYMFQFTLWAPKCGVSIARQKCCACNFLYWPVGLLCLIEMVTLPSSPRPSSTASSIDIETNTDYLKIAKKGGGHKGKYWSWQQSKLEPMVILSCCWLFLRAFVHKACELWIKMEDKSDHELQSKQ